MKVAGVTIPAKLEFGNEEHISLRKTIESRLSRLEKGLPCDYCGSRMKGHAEFDRGYIRWQCGCGETFKTDLDAGDLIP